MNMRQTLRFGCFLLLTLGVSLSSHAQSETATLSGRVADPQGAVVPGARVEVTNILTNISSVTETNSHGLYVVPNLRPGQYRIVVRKAGFNEVVKTAIELHVQDVVVHNFSLNVGSLSQSVTVVAKGGGMSTSPAVSTVINRKFVENLPLNGRSFSTLIELTPGVVLTPGNFATGQFSVNGQRSTSNAFIIDGVSANVGIGALNDMGPSGGSTPAYSASGGTNNLVSIDAMEEFRIQTSTFSAEFGRQPGAQVSVVTRSGTNDFHGTLFNYFRNDKLDANDWFANSLNAEKAALRQNDFGGVIGGPIVKDRTFFFFSYEGLRLRQPKFIITQVPTEAARQLAPPETKPLLDAFPLPNGPNLPDTFPPFSSMLAEFSSAFSIPSTLDAYSLKLDQSWGKLRLFGRYNHAPSTFDSRFVPYQESPGRFKTQTLTVGATWAFTPNVINEFRGNWSRSVGAGSNRLVEMGGNVIPPDSALFPSFTSSQESQINIGILILGTPSLFTGFTLGKATNNRQRQFNFVDTLSIVKGSHQLKFGVDYQRLSPIRGNVPWTGVGTFFGVPGAISGTAFAFSITAQEEELTFAFNNLSLYAQDTWKATPRLTLTYGLRWEYIPPPSEKEGRLPFTVVGLSDPATMTLAPQGTPLWKATRDNFAPRAGVAYHLSQKWGLVLRGGAGLFYELGNGPALIGASSWPYTRSKSLFSVPWPLDDATAQPPPVSLAPPFGFLFVADSNLKLPYSVEWNLALEKSLGPNQTVSATYVGQTSRRLLRQELRNLSTINPNFTFVIVARNEATSDYHAGQFQFQRRLSRGLQALVNYTWSHAIDEVSEESFIGVPDELLDQVSQIERGSADFDVRHSFTAALTYDIPSPAQGGAATAVLGNWSVDSIVRARSGPPITVLASAVVQGEFISSRADLVPGELIWIKDPSAPAGKRINPAAFSVPPAGRVGNLGRNTIKGLSISQVDFSLRRQFTLTERTSLQFRADFFNIFNHPNFNNPSPFISSFSGSLIGDQATQMLGRSLGSGGIVGGLNPLFQIGGPRSIQFALRLSF